MPRRFAYQVVSSTYDGMEVGTVLIYKRSYGDVHSEIICSTETAEYAGHFCLEKVGTCWAVGNKIQFEKPPKPSGVMTEGIMSAVRKRADQLKALLNSSTRGAK